MIDIKNYNDNKPVSLLAKWLPSIKTHNKKNYFAVKLTKKLNLTEKEYRKIFRRRDKYKFGTTNRSITFWKVRIANY